MTVLILLWQHWLWNSISPLQNILRHWICKILLKQYNFYYVETRESVLSFAVMCCLWTVTLADICARWELNHLTREKGDARVFTCCALVESLSFTSYFRLELFWLRTLAFSFVEDFNDKRKGCVGEQHGYVRSESDLLPCCQSKTDALIHQFFKCICMKYNEPVAVSDRVLLTSCAF